MKKTILATIFGAIVSVGVVHAAPADDVKALLEQKKPLEAYNLGRANADQFGNPSFDFYYGIAAIDAGHAGEGVLALERYLLSFPDNRSARFQLARGYYVLGEDQRARDEFQTLLADASGDEKTAAERFLDAIKAREGRYAPTASAFLEAGIGYDSNVNAGLDAGATPSIPGFGRLPLQRPNSVTVKQADAFTTLVAGVQGAYPIAPKVSLYGAAGVDARYLGKGENSLWNQVNLGGSGGISYLTDRELFKLGVGYAQAFVDSQDYVTTTSLTGEWQHQYDQFNRFVLGGQAAHLVYDDMDVPAVLGGAKALSRNSVRDSDFYGLSGSWIRSFNTDYLPVLNVTASFGQEVNQGRHPTGMAARPDLSRDMPGIRAGLSLTPAPRWGASIGLAYQQSNFKDKFMMNPASTNRQDQTTTLDGSISYFYSKQLSVRGELAATTQDSNIGLYEFDRYVVGVKMRYEFK